METERIALSHAYPHADSSLLQVSIEFFCLSITVVQFLFTTFTGLFHKKCNRLKARVVIYAYNHHVRLLSPEPWSLSNQSLLGSRSRHCYAIKSPVGFSLD